MKAFFERIEKAYNSQGAWNREPLFFKVFMIFAVLVWGLLKVVYCILAFITVPLWIVPYMIFWIRKEKKR